MNHFNRINSIVLFVFVVLITTRTSAQNQNVIATFGIYTHAGLTRHIIDYSMFYASNPFTTPYGNNVPDYQNVTGDVWGIGGLYEHTFDKILSMSLRIGYSEYSTGTINITDNKSQGSSVIQSKLAMSLKEFAAEPLATLKIYKELKLLAGARIGYITKHYFNLNSTVISGTYRFSDGTRQETIRSDFPDDGVLLTSFTFGLSYDFKPFSKDNIVLSPEALFSIGMTNYIRGKEWTLSPFRFGITAKYLIFE